MKACFLDTSAVIDLFRRRAGVREALEPFEELLLGYVVFGELLAGANRSGAPTPELARLEVFPSGVQIVGADEETARAYGALCGELERRGERVPTNDLWVAALCVQCDLPLVCRDAHFHRMPRLQVVSY